MPWKWNHTQEKYLLGFINASFTPPCTAQKGDSFQWKDYCPSCILARPLSAGQKPAVTLSQFSWSRPTERLWQTPCAKAALFSESRSVGKGNAASFETFGQHCYLMEENDGWAELLRNFCLMWWLANGDTLESIHPIVLKRLNRQEQWGTMRQPTSHRKTRAITSSPSHWSRELEWQIHNWSWSGSRVTVSQR